MNPRCYALFIGHLLTIRMDIPDKKRGVIDFAPLFPKVDYKFLVLFIYGLERKKLKCFFRAHFAA